MSHAEMLSLLPSKSSRKGVTVHKTSVPFLRPSLEGATPKFWVAPPSQPGSTTGLPVSPSALWEQHSSPSQHVHQHCVDHRPPPAVSAHRKWEQVCPGSEWALGWLPGRAGPWPQMSPADRNFPCNYHTLGLALTGLSPSNQVGFLNSDTALSPAPGSRLRTALCLGLPNKGLPGGTNPYTCVHVDYGNVCPSIKPSPAVVGEFLTRLNIGADPMTQQFQFWESHGTNRCNELLSLFVIAGKTGITSGSIKGEGGRTHQSLSIQRMPPCH